METAILATLASYYDVPLALYSSRGHVTAVCNGQAVEDVRKLGVTAAPDGFSIMVGDRLVPLLTARATAALLAAGLIEKVAS